MKKNKMMRIASVLLVAVLLSTCAISGTFAKYTTSNDAQDTARVAKWGVQITTSSDIFNETYAKNDANVADTNITNTVEVDTEGTNVVAPGTANSVEFAITGTPEVAVSVKFELTINKEIKIPSGTTVGEETLTADYMPVKFTLKEKDADTALAEGTLTDIKTYLEGANMSKNYAPNTELDKIYVLSWEWAFDDETNSGSNDAKDTFLGNAAVTPVTDVVTDLDFEFVITVTQID